MNLCERNLFVSRGLTVLVLSKAKKGDVVKLDKERSMSTCDNYSITGLPLGEHFSRERPVITRRHGTAFDIHRGSILKPSTPWMTRFTDSEFRRATGDCAKPPRLIRSLRHEQMSLRFVLATPSCIQVF